MLFALGLQMCAGQTSSSTLFRNFTLSAVNTTLPSMTGVLLVLGIDGATTGATLYYTSTFTSYPYNDYPTQALVDGSLRAFTKTGEWMTNATAISPGYPLRWITSTFYRHSAAQDYGAELQPGGPLLLSALGFTNMWSLCRSYKAQTIVVFNVSATKPSPYLEFDPASCYKVELNINLIWWHFTSFSYSFNLLYGNRFVGDITYALPVLHSLDPSSQFQLRTWTYCNLDTWCTDEGPWWLCLRSC